MKPARPPQSPKHNPYFHCAVVAILYLILLLLIPANKTTLHQYNWSTFDYHLIYLLIVLPMIAIWFIAFYGYQMLRKYSETITASPDGPDFARLSRGVAWLAWGLPIPSIASLVLNAIANKHPGFHAAAIIIANYISLVLPLIAFIIIGNGSRGLMHRAKLNITLSGARTIIFIFVLFGVLFCYLNFRHFDLTANNSNNPYYLPAWLMVTTIIIPYLYAWFVGLLAAYEIAIVAAKSRGLFYRQALRMCSFGIVAVIASSIVLQYISSVEPRSGHLELNYRLLAAYLFRIVAAGGFAMIAIGARHMRKIEEV
jgi:hypothetical protein